jgi:hypothetical protein
MRKLDDVYTYYKQAIDTLERDHPNYDEVKSLLFSQVNDELDDIDSYNRRGRRAS